MGIGRTLQIIFALLVTLLAQFVRAKPILNVLPANRDIFFNRHQQYVLTLVPLLGIGRTPQITFAGDAILHVMLAQAQATLNALPVIQDTFCNRLQQHALILVQTGIGKTLQITFAFSAILFVLLVLAGPILNVLLANRGIFCNRHQQYVLTLVPLLDIGKIPQTTFALNAMMPAQLARMRVILNALIVIQGIFYSQHLRQQRALTLVQLNIGRTPPLANACLAIMLAQIARTEPILNAHLAN